MPSLSDHSSTEFVKALLIGDPGSGKTGALTSLVKAGYNVRIYDFDNLLGSLVSYVMKDCPDKVDNVKFQTFTDKLKAVENPLVMIGNSMAVMPNVDGTPKAYISGLKQMDNWKVGDEDLGKPKDWGRDVVLVVDSLTSFSQAAFRYVKAMNPLAKEPQAQYHAAQQLIMNFIYLLGQEDFRCHVILIAHIDYDKNHLNITKGFPRSVGSALNSQIAGNFNSVLLAEVAPDGKKRHIRTTPNGIVDLKNPVAFKVNELLPLETGLADFFKAVTNYEPQT